MKRKGRNKMLIAVIVLVVLIAGVLGEHYSLLRGNGVKLKTSRSEHWILSRLRMAHMLGNIREVCTNGGPIKFK